VGAPYRDEIATLMARLVEGVGELETGPIHQQLGLLHARLGEGEKAVLHLTTARRLFEARADRRSIGSVDSLIGSACALKGEHERAAAYFERARETAAQLGDDDLAARVANDMADAATARGERDAAGALWESARLHFEEHWDGGELARVYAGLAVQHADRGDQDAADRLSERALADAEASGDPLYLGRALLARAHVLGTARDPSAKRFFERAIAVFEEQQLRRDLAEAYLAFALFVGDAEQAGEEVGDSPTALLAKAQALFREVGGLGDLERVREAFRRHGRRGTDKIAQVEVLELVNDLQRKRLEVQREIQRLADQTFASFDRLAESAPRELTTEIESARDEVTRSERAVAVSVQHLGSAEEKFLGALDTVMLERENIRTLLDSCRSLNEARDYAQLPRDIATMAARLSGADRALVALIDPAGGMAIKGSVGIDEGNVEVWRPIVDALAEANGSPRLVPAGSTTTESGASREVSSRAAEHTAVRLGVAMVCPLRQRDRVFGAIYCDKQLCDGVFAEHDLELLTIFAAQASAILEHARFGAELGLAARTRAATLEAISDGVVSFAASGVVTSINAAAIRMLDVVGTAERDLASFSDMPFLGGLLARGEEVDGRVVRLSSGDHLLNTRCVRDAAGAVAGLVVTLTEMKRVTSLAQKIVGSTARFTFGDIVGAAPALRRQLRLAEAAARTDSSVLITGESGTGKELIAQAIHNAGSRAAGPFVGINCAAIPRELLESELFGYEAGAFTGAKRGGHPGKFELAEGGTILLDEIGDLPLEMQAKLLRVLQERRVQRLGATKEVSLDTRVIATTNRDLAEDTERGRFRQDLFFRLRVIHVELPPLRTRTDDIPLLVDHFIRVFSARLGKQVAGVTPELMRMLIDYPWRGNVRELEHIIEGEINLADAGQRLLTDMPAVIESASTHRSQAAALGLPVGQGMLSMAQSDRQLLLTALAAHDGNIGDVARVLGVSRGTVYNKMKKFGIDPESYRTR
jgi:transcriptional regulator with PAS, ATPase and Fis domain